jgi:hypothetical protein
MDAMLIKQGCNIGAPVHKGKSWTFSSGCKLSGRDVRSVTVMTVSSPTAYRLVVDATAGMESSHEVLEARRVGDCPK